MNADLVLNRCLRLPIAPPIGLEGGVGEDPSTPEGGVMGEDGEDGEEGEEGEDGEDGEEGEEGEEGDEGELVSVNFLTLCFKLCGSVIVYMPFV